MRMKRRDALKMLGAGAGAAFLGAPQLVFGQEAGQIIVALDDIPPQLDPLLQQNNRAYRTLWNMYDSLLTVDYLGDGSIQPALAESWKRVDGKTLELTLREGVKFHDGSTVATEDVAFSFGPERRTDPDSPGYGTAQQFLSTIDTVEAVDARTVRVTSSVDDPTLEMRMTAWGSQIISKAAFEAAGGFEGFAQAPVGTGPFKVVSLSADKVELEAFQDYWGGTPDIDRLIFRKAPELSSRIAGLISGDFDIIVDVPTDQFEPITSTEGLEVVGGDVASVRVIKFDTRNETLADKRIRRALALSIDRKAIVDALWGGLVSIPNGHQLPSFGPLYNPDRQDWEFDPDTARSLIAEAGYDGTPIPYRVRAAAYGPELATAQVLVSMWEAVGFNIDLQVKENFGQLMEYPGTGMRNGVDPVLVADPLFGFWRSYNESEREVWQNEEFWELGHKLESSLNVEDRLEAYTRMMDIFDFEDPPAFILHLMGTFYGKRKDIIWQPSGSVYLQFADVTTE
jgi:peptide/nickel transport system substrate-binding protein